MPISPSDGERRYQLGRKMLLPIPFAHVRPDFRVGELAHRAAEQLLLFRQAEVHGL